ncbi:Aste57867_6369 [Aphanomyces stellatus]|uniref:Aste57867_6369 protein n=1 Tax=Aphanomyces stellatus TaxID=120398 RepID=A0A485KHT7_9STRA|nr:hypothetical protein As57867_006354 [Aphanomyces stellatus]VFT83364.1 Aste57867_6369 [Aphanomyces stellatus]
MKIAALILSTTFAAVAATAPSVHSLSVADRASLVEELAQWKAKFGGIAKAEGLLPPVSSTRNLDDTINNELQRLLDNKHAVEVASKNNPKAQFSTDHKFALMTEAEFGNYVKGSFDQGSRSLSSLPKAKLSLNASAADTIDWTTGSCMPAVRNQGQCGSCWAFSAVGAAEMGHCIATGDLLDLSEQQVTSCSKEGGNDGCNGGWEYLAIDYVAKTGLCMDSDWPYTSGKSGQTGSCSNKCTKKTLAIGTSVRVSGEDALATSLNTQPVSVAVEAGNSVWMNYQGGIVTQCPGAESDHAVIAVGYDGGAYKVRNSWGASWGESGYIRLERGVGGKGTCNVVSEVSYPQLGLSPTPVPSSATPKPSTPTPSKSTPSPSSSTPKPSTPTPSTSSPFTPAPSTSSPEPGCGTCQACYYPGNNECLPDDYTKDDCDYYNSEYGTIWCGN